MENTIISIYIPRNLLNYIFSPIWWSIFPWIWLPIFLFISPRIHNSD